MASRFPRTNSIPMPDGIEAALSLWSAAIFGTNRLKA
jgi:hypothetical protein